MRHLSVFLSFGSECFLSKEEMEEMARGLELSCVNFIWVVRYRGFSYPVILFFFLAKSNNLA